MYGYCETNYPFSITFGLERKSGFTQIGGITMCFPTHRKYGPPKVSQKLILLAVGQILFVPGITAAQCASPSFTTSDPNGGWSNGGYYIHNNMWNREANLGPETLYACSYKNWYVVSNQADEAGAVKTYPNVHKDYGKLAIGSLTYLTSSFAATSPHVGIYNVSYDIWLNGIASMGGAEVMIWTENYRQVPAGSKAASVTFAGRTYEVWKANWDWTYIALVPTTAMTSGSLDLLEILKWILSKGWIPSGSTIAQICYGVEIVSTDGADARFTFTDFSLSTSPPNGLARGTGPMADGPLPGGRDAYFSLTGERLEPGRLPAAMAVSRRRPQRVFALP